MYKRTDGSIEFKYSVSKLVTRMVVGALLAVVGYFAAEAFISLLENMRIERILVYIEQGLRPSIGDPTWAVLVQMGIIFFVAFGIAKFSLSLFYLVSRQRVFMRIDDEGITYYRFKFSVKRTPHVEEMFIQWDDFFSITGKKGLYFNDVIAFSKTEMSESDPKRTIDVTIKCAEDHPEDIIAALSAHKKALHIKAQ
ncbi:MAG: hypothetical protein FWC75_03550 [Oscillospiraceae bacterium]|nr:hypothetical protein [Oscillospiraceae bacterium]